MNQIFPHKIGDREEGRGAAVLRMTGFHTRERFTAVFLSVLLLVTVVLATFYIAEESDHHCSGDDCPICLCLHQCENIVQTLYGGDTPSPAAGAAAVFFAVLSLIFSYFAAADTLIVRKVRMNN